MKSVLLAGAAFMLVAGANFCAAEAQTNSPARWFDASQVAAQPAEQGDAGVVRPTARYDYQYHYGGSPRHPRWESQGHPAQ
jgi:hypothetical protein